MPPKHTRPNEEQRAQRRRKVRDAALILPVFGVILFASPLISAISSGEGRSTVPLAVQYIFNIWAALIMLTFGLSRLLTRPDTDTDADAGPDTPDRRR